MKTVITSNATQIADRYRTMARKLPGVMDRAVRKLVEDDALPQFEKTVRTWKRKPRFTPIKRYQGWGVRVDPLYPFSWVNLGTRAHVIEAKRAPLLRFTGPYHAKTKPGVIASYTGGRGKVWVSKKRVSHPGTEAREFSGIILRRVQQRAAGVMREALREASYGAGTGL